MYINCKTSLLELKFLIIRINVRFFFIKLARKFFFDTFANIDEKRKIIFMIQPKMRWKILWIKSKQRIRVVRFQENKATRRWNGGNLLLRQLATKFKFNDNDSDIKSQIIQSYSSTKSIRKFLKGNNCIQQVYRNCKNIRKHWMTERQASWIRTISCKETTPKDTERSIENHSGIQSREH